MKHRSIVIDSLPQAYEVIKEMNLATDHDDSDYRKAGCQSLENILKERMQERISYYLYEMARLGETDRRNGYFSRHLLTELGDIELHIPRTRRFSPISILRAYARRAHQVDRMILACFVLGISTRKVALALLPVLGEPVSATTVSRIAKNFDTAVAAFHRRSIRRKYRFLIFDGVVLKRKTGAGSVKRAVLVTLGITEEGRKEVIDFFIAPGESQEARENFLTDLYRRGLMEDTIEMIVTGGGKGLLAALPMIYPKIPIQRCWAHKSRNVLSYVRKADRGSVKTDLHTIQYASGIREAQMAIGAFDRRWAHIYPKAVRCLLNDEEQLLTFLQIKDSSWWSQIRTTNAIERRFKEVR